MSRTDKDRPRRVRAADHRTLTERHHGLCECCAPHRAARGARLPCDIDSAGIHTRCYRVGRDDDPWWWLRHCPGWYRQLFWVRPDRRRARAACAAAVRDWNGNGDTDIDPPAEQYRHRATWDYW